MESQDVDQECALSIDILIFKFEINNMFKLHLIRSISIDYKLLLSIDVCAGKNSS